MPNRIIKESIGTSETLAQLTGSQERHFWRMLVQADDYGRFDARPHAIRARAYAAMLDRVGEKESESMTQALAKAGLITLYEHEGRRYGHFVTWDKHQQTRAKVSKYPQPPADDSIGNHVLADASSRLHMSPYSESESESESRIDTRESIHANTNAEAKPSTPSYAQDDLPFMDIPKEDQEVWPDWYATLYAIPGFKTSLKDASAWLAKRNITEERAESTAYSLKSKWPGPKANPYKDAWATFQSWARGNGNGTFTQHFGANHTQAAGGSAAGRAGAIDTSIPSGSKYPSRREQGPE